MLKDAAKNKPNIDVVKLHKSEGVVPRNPKYRQKTRSFRIKVNYFSDNKTWKFLDSTFKSQCFNTRRCLVGNMRN